MRSTRLWLTAVALLVAFAAPAVAHAGALTNWNAIGSRAIVATAGQSLRASPLRSAMRTDGPSALTGAANVEDLAAADGAIGCWNGKAYWHFWRSITAIREAPSDGKVAHYLRKHYFQPLQTPATPAERT